MPDIIRVNVPIETRGVRYETGEYTVGMQIKREWLNQEPWKSSKETGAWDWVYMEGKSDGGSSSYYQLPDGARELDDLLKNMTWHQANIFKAAYRWDTKPDLRYNLNKIIWFAERALRDLK